jgi:hypothetical protein
VKKLLILAGICTLAFSACVSNAQPVVGSPIVKIIDTTKTKDEAFDLAMRWMSASFKSSKQVIQYTDKNLGTINGEANLTTDGTFGQPYLINFQLIIDLKDNKARLTFTPESVMVPTASSREMTLDDTALNQFKAKVESMAADFHDYVNNNATSW